MTDNHITLWVEDMIQTFKLFDIWPNPPLPPPEFISIPFVLKREDYQYTDNGIFQGRPSGSGPYYSKYSMDFHCGKLFVMILPWSWKTAHFYTEIQNAPFEDTLEPRLTKYSEEFRDIDKPWRCVVCGILQPSDGAIIYGHSELHTVFGRVWFRHDFTCGCCVITGRSESFAYPVLAKERNKRDPPRENVEADIQSVSLSS
jgi:hypothetical protein